MLRPLRNAIIHAFVYFDVGKQEGQIAINCDLKRY